MPIIKSAIKRAKQTVKRRERNVATKRVLKDALKAFNAKPSAKALSAVNSAIDIAVKKNVLNKNTAARRKALFSRTAKAAGVKLTGAASKASAKPAAKTGTKTAAKTTAKPATKPAAKSVAKKPVAKKPAAKSAAKPAAKKPAAKKA